MESYLIVDSLEASLRTLRLAQAQIANIKRKCVHSQDAAKTQEELESIEVILTIVVTKVEELRMQ